MAATPKHATMSFKGRSGNIYSVDSYFSDVANALVTFDDGQGAGSGTNTFWIAPEPCYLFDVSIITGMADTTRAMVARNSIGVGVILDYTTHVSTASFRPTLRIPFGTGSKLTVTQLA